MNNQTPPMMILIAGPCRSGTNDEPNRMLQNLHALEQHAIAIFRLGHVPMIGEWVALPIIRNAGSKRVGDFAYEQFLYPVAARPLERPDAVLRIAGTSKGADEDVRGERRAAVEVEPMSMPAASHRQPWFAGDLAYRIHKSGTRDGVPAARAEPFALQPAERRREAVCCSKHLGCPDEQARARADGTAEAQQKASTIFERLGARPAADAVRRTSRASGRGLRRGIRASTQANPHDLTDREFEVLLLLCEGLKNSEIAARLCRSVRTVDHHVAAAFAKLGVSSRAQAIATALRTGI